MYQAVLALGLEAILGRRWSQIAFAKAGRRQLESREVAGAAGIMAISLRLEHLSMCLCLYQPAQNKLRPSVFGFITVCIGSNGGSVRSSRFVLSDHT